MGGSSGSGASSHFITWNQKEPNMPVPTEDLDNLSNRFWYRVDKESGPIHPIHRKCWIWTGGKSEGRGMMSWKGKMIRASKASWILYHKTNPSLCILHKCDNPICVNPEHLFLGTLADNIYDMMAKGRDRGFGKHKGSYGEDHYAAKLSDIQILEILIRLAKGEPQNKLAEEFGTTQSYVSLLKHGRKRKYLFISKT